MAECHSDPQTNLLYPWALDTVESTWNRLGAEALGFRVWTAGKANSRSKAAASLTSFEITPIGLAVPATPMWMFSSNHLSLT